MWETKETLEGGQRIDRTWCAAVKVGAIVAESVLVAITIAIAFLWPALEPPFLGRAVRGIIRAK